MARKKKTMTTPEEARDTVLGAVLADEAPSEVRQYMQTYGFTVSSGDNSISEWERHQRYELADNVKVLLQTYRQHKSSLKFYKENLPRLVAEMTDSSISQNDDSFFFENLCEKLDLVCAYDSKKQQYFENLIRSYQYIEKAINAVDFAVKLLELESPEECALLKTVYIDGDRQPTVQQCLEKHDISNTSTYYRRLENARNRISFILFGNCLDRNQMFEVLVLMKQIRVNGPGGLMSVSA